MIRKPVLALSTCMACIALLAQTASASVWYWDNNGVSPVTSGTWDNSTAEWSTTSALSATPVAWNSANAAGFPAGTAGVSALNITLSGTLASGGVFNGLTTGVGVTNLTIVGPGTLSLNAGLDAFYMGAATYNTIIKAQVTGTGTMQNQNSGSLYLSGNNIYSGGFSFGSGAGVNINNGLAFGTGLVSNGVASTVIATPATDSAGGAFATSAINITNSVATFGGTGSTIFVGIGAAPVTFSGPWTLKGAYTMQNQPAASSVTISGPISGAFAFTKAGAGALTLSGVNTYSGNTTISAGSLAIDGGGKLGNGSYAGTIANSTLLRYSSTAAQKLSGIISGAGSLIVEGPGSLTNSAVNTYTGTNLITGGVLSIAADTGLGAAPGSAKAGSVTIDGGILQHTSAGVGSTFLAGNRGIAIGPNGGTIDIPASGAILIYTSGQITGPNNRVTKTGVGTLRLTTPTSMTFSNLTVSGGLWQGGLDTIYGASPAALNVANITLNGGGISANAGLTLGSTRGITLGASGGQIDCSSSLTVPGPIAGAGALTKSGANTLVLSGANTYTGKTTATAGTLSVNSYNSVAGGVASSSLGAPTTVANGTISLGSGTTAAVNIYIGPGETTDRVLDFAGTTGGATIQADGTGPLEFTADPTFSGSGAKTIILQGTNSGIIDGLITDNGGGATSITKSQAGTWTLNRDNTYTGNTTLNTAGQLNFGNQYAIGFGTFVINQNGLFDNTTGGDITVTNAMTLSGGSPTYVGSANNMTFSGPVSISGANRTITVNNNTLTIAQGITQDATPRSFTKQGAGTLKLQGANGWTVNTTVSNGKLALDGSATLASTGLSIGATGTFDVSTLASSTFTLGMSLTASGTAVSSANVIAAAGGTFDVGNSNIVLTFAPTSFNGDLAHPALIVSQGTLSLSGNIYTVNNNGGTPLGTGVYRLILQSIGNINASGSATLGGVTGSGLAAGTAGSVVVNGNEVDLVVVAAGTFSGLTASQGITYGAPTIGLSGTVSGVGPTYPADGETVAVTINGNTQNATIAGGAGGFSLSFPTAMIPASGVPYTISYAYAGDPNLTAASDTSTTLTVNQAPLTVTANDQTKVYGQTIATGAGNTNFTSSALQNAETIGSVTLAVSGGGDGANAAVAGSPYTITPSAAAGGTFNPNNYNITYLTGNLTVTAASLTVTATGTLTYGDDPSNAVYVASYSPLQGTDDVSVVTGTGDYSTDATATNYVGTNYIAHIVDLGTLSASNYTLVAGPDGVMTITNRPLYATNVLANDKVYDTTAAATANLSGAGLTNFVNGDDASVSLVISNAVATFADKNAGSNKTVTVTGLTTAGDLGTNYFVAPAMTMASIAQLASTISNTGVDKTYDGTSNAIVNVSFTPLGTDVANASYTSAFFDDKNASPGKNISVSGLALSGADAANYSVPSTGTTTATISQATLNVSANGINKLYDGTTAATVTLTDDRIADDVFTDSYTSATFMDKNVAPGKAIAVSGISISGTDANNYALANTTAATSADITARTLTVSATGINKVYDGTTTATATLSDDKVPGDDVSDSYTSAAFADKNVNTGIAVSVTGISISGGDAGNYSLANTTANATANITSEGLTVTGVVVLDKVYDGTTNGSAILTNASLVGVSGSDDVTLVTSNAVASFADKDVGSNKVVSITGLTIAGADAGNYALSQPSTNASITPATLTVSAAGVSKVYDSTTAASVTLSDDKVSGDDVSETYATADFSDANVGTGKTVTVAGINITGADANDYVLAGTTATATADITALASSAGIVSSLNPSTETSNVTFTATISAAVGTPAGDVVFLSNGTAFSTNALVGGVASADNSSLPVGTNTIAVQFAAQGNYLGSTASLDQVVNSAVTFSTNNVIASILNNGDGTFTISAVGTPAALYYLQSTADLNPPVTWTIVPGSTNTAAAGTGNWSFVVTNPPPAFYRSTAVNPAP